MAMMITAACLNCGPCDAICPNDAIQPGDGQYVIDPERCTECVGFFDEPQCVASCPAESVTQHPDYIESREALWAKFERMQRSPA